MLRPCAYASECILRVQLDTIISDEFQLEVVCAPTVALGLWGLQPAAQKLAAKIDVGG